MVSTTHVPILLISSWGLFTDIHILNSSDILVNPRVLQISYLYVQLFKRYHVYRQTHITQTDTQTNTQTNRHTDKHTNKQTHRQTDSQTYKQTNTQTDNKQTHTQTQKQTDTQTNTQTDKDKHIDRQRQTPLYNLAPPYNAGCGYHTLTINAKLTSTWHAVESLKSLQQI